jgi:hypothetical protein
MLLHLHQQRVHDREREEPTDLTAPALRSSEQLRGEGGFRADVESDTG